MPPTLRACSLNLRRLPQFWKVIFPVPWDCDSSIRMRHSSSSAICSILKNGQKPTSFVAIRGVDRQIVKNPISWHNDHLRVGRRYVQMFSLKTAPESSRPCLFSGLLALDCDSVLCSTWRPKSTAAARGEIDAQEKFISFFKVGVLTRVMSGRDLTSLETGAGAKAANSRVDDLE